MFAITRELLSYLCFIWMIYLISYANRNPHAHQQVNHLRHFLLNQGHAQHDYMKVSADLSQDKREDDDDDV